MLTANEKQLVEEIAAEKNLGTKHKFDSSLGEKGKFWFCQRVAERSTGQPLANIELNVRGTIDRAEAVIEAWKGMEGMLEPVGLLARAQHEKAKKLARIRRVETLHQIVVCALTIHPELAEELKEPILKQVVAQRLRISDRLYLLSNERLSPFAFPSNGHQLSSHAAGYWVLSGEDWILSASGMVDPQAAILHLFERSDSATLNRFFCQHAASAILVDALLPLDGIDSFDLSSKAQSPGYLRLGDPFRDPGVLRFAHDDTSTGRFEIMDIPLDDLQIGDHVHARNLEIYSLLYPSGLWAGEHSLVSSRFGDDPTASLGTWAYPETQGAITLEGLGLESGTTVASIRSKLLEKLNLRLNIARDAVEQHMLAHGGTNGPVAPSPSGPPAEPRFIDLNGVPIWRDTVMEQSITDPNQLVLVWHVGGRDPLSPEHYLWEWQASTTTFDRWEEEFVTQQAFAIPYDYDISEVWGREHPLTGTDKMVRVTRPRIAR